MSTIDERRRELIRILEEVVPESHVTFDMEQWYDIIWDDVEEAPCGTVACALGSLCLLSPMAKEDGFILQYDAPYYRHVSGYKAAEKYFHMLPLEVTNLFSYTHYRPGATPQEVAIRARELWGIE